MALALVLCAPLLLALFGLGSAWLTPAPDAWGHLRAHVLPRATANTVLLMTAVGIGCSVIGLACAWVNARCDYPGRRFFDWALLLPLALPTYVVAFATIGLFDYAGPFQSLWRDISGSRATLFTPHGAGWASLVLTLCFYPYVYLTLRSLLLRQGDAMVDVARTLGLSATVAFFRVRLPLLRPALVAGLGLALLETLAEFGAVSLFGVDTLTTAVYKTWFGLFSLPAAAQLASIGFLLALLLLMMEWRGRARQRQHGGQRVRLQRHRLRTGPATAVIVGQGVLLLLAFVLPIGQLLIWSGFDLVRVQVEWPALRNTVIVALLSAGALVASGLMLAGLRRTASTGLVRATAVFATMGYAVPGTVLATGLLLAILLLESMLVSLGFPDPALTGSVAVLVLAMYVRFLRAAAEPLAASMAQVTPSLVEAAQTLGIGPRQRLFALTLPLLRPGLLAATLLVMIEVMKEMPATLMLRPFGWDTLAVRIHAFTSEGMWQEASVPALILVLAGLAPVWLLVRLQEQA